MQPFDLSDDVGIPTDVLGLVPKPVARESRVIPLGDTPAGLVMAMSNPLDVETVDKLQFILNRKIRIVYVPSDWIDRQLRNRYGTDDDDVTA